MNDWPKRSLVYNNLNWVKDRDFLNFFILHCNPKPHFTALDIGCGTGIIGKGLSPLVKRVIAVDISPDMLKKATTEPNLEYTYGDAQCLQFPDNSFDLVTMRMALHHIEDTGKAVSEAYRVLKKRGRFVLCEGVPPDAKTRPRYEQIFALKEKRHTFLEGELVDALSRAGFKNIQLKLHFMPQVSLLNWLKNSAVDEKTMGKILKMHLNAGKHFKDIYRLNTSEGDIFIDWKFALVSGKK